MADAPPDGAPPDGAQIRDDDLDSIEAELRNAERTLEHLADENIDPAAAAEWIPSAISGTEEIASGAQSIAAGTQDGTPSE